MTKNSTRTDALSLGACSEYMLSLLESHFAVHRPDDLPAFLESHGERIESLIAGSGEPIDSDFMNRTPNLRIIANFGVGYDNIDAKEAARRGIMVIHTPNVLNEDVADSAILLMLASFRNLLSDNAWLREGKWKSIGDPPLSRSAENRTVGILGMGRIGSTIARKLSAFNATVTYFSRSEKETPWKRYSDLEAMARDCDALICALPGGEATRNMISKRVIEALGPEGVLVNIGRGSAVDEPALIEALKSGRLGKAGLDVFHDEPNPSPALLGLENVTLLPHTGSSTEETTRAMEELVVENLVRFHREGKAITPVPECQ